MKWFEIFKAGTHTDSSGVERKYTEKDLDTMVSKYNPSEHEAPLVIGHPKTNDPAYGWVEKIKRVGDRLLALPKQVVPEFEEMVEKGMFKKISMSHYPNMTLRHVGFLGAVPPAIKGLKDIEFNEGENEIVIEFSENYRINSIGRVFQNLRDWLIEKFGMEVADQVASQYVIDDLKQNVPEAEGLPDFGENNNPGEEMDNNELQKELAELKTKVAEYSEAVKTKDAENALLKKQLADTQTAERKKDYTSFCEKLIKEGRLLPANKDSVMQNLEAAWQSGAEVNYAESGETKTISAVDNLKRLLSAMPVSIDFQEIATKEAAGGQQSENEPETLAKKAREYRDKQKGQGYEISFTEAVNHVKEKK
jgi:hypothetical protein